MSAVISANMLATIAALIGDTARANILFALMGGKALTAGELAASAGVTAQTASGHLAKLADAGLVAVEKQGRHRYSRLATPEVAQALHALMTVAAMAPRRHHPTGPREVALRLARTCYDHMAGRLAVAITDQLQADGHIILDDGAGQITRSGQHLFDALGIGQTTMPGKRPLCRTCLDWSERRPHLAGRLGAILLSRLLEMQWLAKAPAGRALLITSLGEKALIEHFRLPVDWRQTDLYPCRSNGNSNGF
ncbi:metalloregulator ArsR/SmtB family transcription factor [Niveispirillum sp. SYP-B3756]|uniref:ArsR/SmtB family transcription factor n=1 Tax=Niveispirillum sp. SYP-B3756 TaxID=2662178 RepID=UPI0012929F59|nr:helix-turn-helix transcriptional regulator [Niveispirillum sp. SYP-B3756]MQP67655.1 metalloregulator ArsR/SmtB family transcription factor [Niveispirillum sp. SYP-B3756]